MKILLLNPHADAEQQFSQALGAKGVAVLVAADAEEAWKILQIHGSTVDLAILHRETTDGKRTPGMELIARIKQDPQQRDLPVVLTSAVWKDAEFAHHQGTPEGVNAYLAWPADASVLISTAEAVIGPMVTSSPDIPSMPAPPAMDIVLDAAAGQDAPPLEIPAPVSLAPESYEDALSPPPSLAPAEFSEAPFAEEADSVMQVQMPYLLRTGQSVTTAPTALSLAKAVPEAVVPGGAAHAPDIETMRQYMLLREQDLVALSHQLKSARDQGSALEKDLAVEKGRVNELEHTVKEQRSQIEEFEREKAIATEGLHAELNEMKFQMKTRTDRVKVLESQMKEANLEMERVKERVRTDLRKIRVREKELESRLEIMKKDSEALIGARETRIIELKRKLDLLEFNMDLLQDQYQREKDGTDQLRERLAKAAQVVNVAGGLLETRERKVS